MEIIIDGYNLLFVSSNFSARQEELLENARNRLIEKLHQYKRERNISISIVFDGWKGGFHAQSQDMVKGIKIIYSKLGEKADEVIMQIIENSSKEIVVVSSDREIRDFAARHNMVSLSSSEFEKKIELSSYIKMKGSLAKDYDYQEKKFTTIKKGNPKKLSKSERKRRAKLKRL